MKIINKPILHLNLKTEWYDMIDKFIKKEEYRRICPFWNRIFTESGYIKIKGKLYHPTDVIICFSNGYSKTRRQMYFEIKYLRPSFGRKEWGAKENVQYHTIVLGVKYKKLI